MVGNGKTVDELESYFDANDKRLFVERIRHKGNIINDINPSIILQRDMK